MEQNYLQVASEALQNFPKELYYFVFVTWSMGFLFKCVSLSFLNCDGA